MNERGRPTESEAWHRNGDRIDEVFDGDLTPFLLYGPIEAIHCASRRLRIALNDFEVSGAIKLERFRLIERLVASTVD
jgi:hypothetical protein